jgi:1-acyl-sn-glycerol-3-phosphate acyltransferase
MLARLFYCFCALTVRILATIVFRFTTSGVDHVPRTGPLLVVCNHASNFDPPLVAGGVLRRRQVRFLAKKELWKSRFLGRLIGTLGAFPVDRASAGDRQAIAASVEILRRGEALLVFPEGTRTLDGRLQPFREGAARLALMVPGTRIVPLRLTGTFEAWGKGKVIPRPVRVRLRVGESFDPRDLATADMDRKSLYRAVTTEMVTRISQL